MDSVIRLFKAVPVKTKETGKLDEDITAETIKRGFVFAPEVFSNYSQSEIADLIRVVEKEIGLTAEKMNASFHKSWGKVADADILRLVCEQIIHYITTYGFKSLGIYDENSVYIPFEKLDIPQIEEGKIRLVVIKGYTKEELKKKLLELLGLGVALAENTIKDACDIALYVELSQKEIEATRNKETRVMLYDYLDIMPEEPVEFLRYLIYKATDKTLIIKSADLIEEIKGKQNLNIASALNKYEQRYGLERLAEIFYRFKPLFLSFRTNTASRKTINRIRRLATSYHKPMSEDYLNAVTARIKNGTINEARLREELTRVNIFRKIRLAYALNFRTKEAKSILYRIRNGKGYARPFAFAQKGEVKTILDTVMDSIAGDIRCDKKIYIPENVVYSLPATEKQFTGNFPSGTYISLPKDMIVGVNWENLPDYCVDLDLSLISASTKFGWDGSYRSEDRDILFSGDITDAPKPKGATELFYVKRQAERALIVLVNFYNYEKGKEVPFKTLVARENVEGLTENENYMVNPNNVVAIAKSTINQKQKVLGLLVTTGDESRFYFAETFLGRSISSSGSVFVENARKYFFSFYQNTITLKDVLEKAGAKMVTEREKADIDLSPEILEKDTILRLITKGK